MVAAAAARLKVEKGKTLKKCVNGKQGRGEADSNAQHGTDSSGEEPHARARTHAHALISPGHLTHSSEPVEKLRVACVFAFKAYDRFRLISFRMGVCVVLVLASDYF